MNPAISTDAATMIENITMRHIEKLGSSMVPLVVWFTDDEKNFPPSGHLGIGYIEQGNINRDKIINKGARLEIYNYIPEDILALYKDCYIDILEGNLVFAKMEINESNIEI